MNARQYDQHRRHTRLLILDAAIMCACVAVVLISGIVTYYATISRIFSAIVSALPH